MSTRDVEGPVCSHVWAVLVLLWPRLGWLEDREHPLVASLKHRSLVIQKLSRNQPTSKADWLFPFLYGTLYFSTDTLFAETCLCFVQRKSHSRFNSKKLHILSFFSSIRLEPPRVFQSSAARRIIDEVFKEYLSSGTLYERSEAQYWSKQMAMEIEQKLKRLNCPRL